jgi:hypothetical protein
VRKAIVTAALLASTAAGAAAQTPLTYVEFWNNRVQEIKKLRDTAPLDLVNRIGGEIAIGGNVEAFVLFAYAQNLPRELRFIEDARTDKQLGSPAATPGSTSLVSRGAVPGIFGFAVEHGAMTQTANATSATVRGNAVGWLDLLKEQNFIESYDNNSALVRGLRRLSYSFTFNTEQAGTAAQPARPDPAALKQQLEEAGRQLSSYSARFSIVDQRDPRRRDNRAAAAKVAGSQGAALAEAAAFMDPVLLSDDYDRWLEQTQVALSAPQPLSTADVERVLYTQLEALRALMDRRIPTFADDVARFVTARNVFYNSRAALFDRMQKRFVMAVELVRLRPAAVPASSTYRLVAEGRPGGGAWNLTGNAAVTRQDEGTVFVPEARETRGWRDLQVGVQAERLLGRGDPCASEGAGKPALAFEYLLQDLRDNATVTFGGFHYAVEKGRVHVAQAKLTIPIKGSGVKVPLSVSIANRTELLREKNVRGHIGVTFDMDVLAAAVRR